MKEKDISMKIIIFSDMVILNQHIKKNFFFYYCLIVKPSRLKLNIHLHITVHHHMFYLKVIVIKNSTVFPSPRVSKTSSFKAFKLALLDTKLENLDLCTEIISFKAYKLAQLSTKLKT